MALLRQYGGGERLVFVWRGGGEDFARDSLFGGFHGFTCFTCFTKGIFLVKEDNINFVGRENHQ